MPLLTTPIFSVRSIRRLPGRTAPGRATGTRWPGAMLVAPHTISSGSPEPVVTVVSDSRSARGWRSTVRSSPDHHVAPVGAPRLDPLDLHPEQGQPLGERLGGQVDVDELAQPAERHPHRNCSRKRRSFSMYRRRSPTLWRRLAIRSTPMPKAKPW